MTIYRVRHDGDDSDGSSWIKAFQSILKNTVLAATGGTDEIWVEKGHVEGSSSAINIAFTGGTIDDPIEIYSINKDASDAYLPGGLIDTTSSTGAITLSGFVRWFGVDFSCTHASADINFGSATSQSIGVFDATFTAGDRIELASIRYFEATNCTFDSSDTTDGIRLDAATISNFRKCVFVQAAAAAFNFVEITNNLTVEDSDLTNAANLVQDDVAEHRNVAVFRRCSLKSGYSVYEDAPGSVGSSTLVEASTSATDATPLGLQAYENYYGTVKSTLVQRRDTAGADDGVQANEHSWVMVANAKTREFWQPLKSPPITVWVAGGSSLTFKIYVASTAAVQNDECWMELSGPDNTATSTTQGYRESTKMGWTTSIDGDPKATPADLTTDTVDDWEGANTGTPQEMSITYTPDQAGPVTIHVCLAVAATKTIYVDPKIEVT